MASVCCVMVVLHQNNNRCAYIYTHRHLGSLHNVCSVRCRHKVERQMIVAAKLETFLSHLFLHTCKHMEFKIWQATCPWNVPIHEDYLTSIQCILCTFPFIPYSTSFMKSMLGMVRSTDKKFTFSLGS